MNRSASQVATERPKVPKSAKEFFNLPDRILLHGEISVGKVAVGEISDGEVSVGEISSWENCRLGEIVLRKFIIKNAICKSLRYPLDDYLSNNVGDIAFLII